MRVEFKQATQQQQKHTIDRSIFMNMLYVGALIGDITQKKSEPMEKNNPAETQSM